MSTRTAHSSRPVLKPRVLTWSDSLYQEMSVRMITPNTVTQNTVLGGYGKVGKLDEMERVLSGMLESDSCKTRCMDYEYNSRPIWQQGGIDALEIWYEKFRGIGIERETRTFNILIGAYGKKRMYDKMSSVMEYMLKLAFPWTTSTYNNVIEAFADVGDAKFADVGDAKNMEYAFNQMGSEAMKADTKTFCCLINGFSNAGMFHKVVSIIQLAEKLEVTASSTFYNAVIYACAKAGDLLEMERVLERMKDKHFAPDLTTYSIMVGAYGKEGMSDKIYDLEQESMHLSGVELFSK